MFSITISLDLKRVVRGLLGSVLLDRKEALAQRGRSAQWARLARLEARLDQQVRLGQMARLVLRDRPAV